MELRIEEPDGDEGLEDWRYVHNVIVPPAAMSLEEVRGRRQRNRLEVVYRDGELIGCTTVRPPTDDSSTATVIVRVLPAYRRQGIGEHLYTRCLEVARGLGADVIETVVLASNVDGLRFAETHGFVEVSRFEDPEDDDPFIVLRLSPDKR